MSNVDWEVDWNFWLNMPTVKLWQAVALSMDLSPEAFSGVSKHLGSWLKAETTQELIGNGDNDRDRFNKRLELLKAHVFDTDNLNVTSISANNVNSVIYLNDFVDWTLKVKWDIPKELETLVTTKEKVEDKLYREDKPNGEPWREHREGDPKPKHDWYTPARYFARELVRDDSNLLTKKKYLYQKISDSLADVGIYKRGGKKAFDSQTIRKALANIKYDR